MPILKKIIAKQNNPQSLTDEASKWRVCNRTTENNLWVITNSDNSKLNTISLSESAYPLHIDGKGNVLFHSNTSNTIWFYSQENDINIKVKLDLYELSLSKLDDNLIFEYKGSLNTTVTLSIPPNNLKMDYFYEVFINLKHLFNSDGHLPMKNSLVKKLSKFKKLDKLIQRYINGTFDGMGTSTNCFTPKHQTTLLGTINQTNKAVHLLRKTVYSRYKEITIKIKPKKRFFV
jgi:hypothetical protein